MSKGQITAVGAILVAVITVLGSVTTARITASATTDSKNNEQDNKITGVEKDYRTMENRLNEIQGDVKVIKCAVIGRNDPVIFEECQKLNK